MQYKAILTPSFPQFCVELQDALESGFKLDFDNLPRASFTYYEAVLVRDDVKEELKAVFSEDPDKIDFNNVVSVLPSSEEAGKRGRKPKAVKSDTTPAA